MLDFKDWWSQQDIFCGEGGMGAAEQAFDAALEMAARGRSTKTPEQIIDALGEWLCDDLEKSVRTSDSISQRSPGLMSSSQGVAMDRVRDIGGRIKWYRDNVL